MALIDIAAADLELVGFMKHIGWYAGRQVDLTADLDAWAAGGYIVSDAAREFMAECSGLGFEYARHPAVGGTHTCLLSGVAASRHVARSVVTEYEQRLGSSLCPVGQSASGHLLLLMAPTGAMYGGYDQFFASIADDGYRALRAIRDREPVARL